MRLQAIVFDLGGTLIEYSGPYQKWPDMETPGFLAAYAVLQTAQLPLPDFQQFQQTGFDLLPIRWQAAVKGKQNLRLIELLADVLAAYQVVVPPNLLDRAARAYEQAIQQQARPMPMAKETVARLKEAGYRLGLISNTMFTGAAHEEDLRRFGLREYFDELLFSADVNKWKPNADPFWHVLEALQVAPETAVYIGDDPASDVVGGQRAGMFTIHYHSHSRFPTPNGVHPHARIFGLDELIPALRQLENRTQ
ncbi:MAG: HAD family hydrolase [Chloroflexi bacterium]|nr:MAG: HAD family hydrolase [Chloroflexota bacterium]